jgi:hypothetical protein
MQRNSGIGYAKYLLGVIKSYLEGKAQRGSKFRDYRRGHLKAALKKIETFNGQDPDTLEKELKGIPNTSRWWAGDLFVSIFNEALKTGKSPDIQSMADSVTITVKEVCEVYQKAVYITENGSISGYSAASIASQEITESKPANLPAQTEAKELQMATESKHTNDAKETNPITAPTEPRELQATTESKQISHRAVSELPLDSKESNLNPNLSTSATVQTIFQSSLLPTNSATINVHFNTNIHLPNNSQEDKSNNEACCELDFCGATLRLFTSCCTTFFKKRPRQQPQQQIHQQERPMTSNTNM